MFNVWDQFQFGAFGFRDNEELFNVADLILSNTKEKDALAYQKLKIANTKSTLPKPMYFTLTILEFLIEFRRDNFLRTVGEFENYRVDNAKISKRRPRGNPEEVEDYILKPYVLFVYDFMKTNYWAKMRQEYQQKTDSTISKFKDLFTPENTAQFSSSTFGFTELTIIVLPQLMNELLTNENPFGLNFDSIKVKLSDFLTKITQSNQNISTIIKFYVSQKDPADPFVARFIELMPSINDVKIPAYPNGDPWGLTPVGYVYGKRPTDLTLPADQVCEIELPVEQTA
ncbi:hypothetical protein TVAG_087110 [Trichomonas vaginalis G3]|uniref:Uncharacterized protein n=1 Tax=Trichomonas vaginalis (strain ATCC PRA-98 / G3) TaxID=412133 RepID=A2EN25_TRIV3|nr:hypothetical protein TVAGG3_0334520 [Trichomonas vaginalis G3]EAY05933.1 hypothetical protein TVAG_087110 [Trichomonas vaginalis G3]KAI5530170.1 hypothetical protein TVAGG3_0334520 [Trichomonas vaginalis G3]|eukprot:XP_001318156.1 hypothetical protein [Trichomonas vaginalis G3]